MKNDLSSICSNESEWFAFQTHEKQWTWRQEIKIINPVDVQDVKATIVTLMLVAYGCFLKCRHKEEEEEKKQRFFLKNEREEVEDEEKKI